MWTRPTTLQPNRVTFYSLIVLVNRSSLDTSAPVGVSSSPVLVRM